MCWLSIAFCRNALNKSHLKRRKIQLKVRKLTLAKCRSIPFRSSCSRKVARPSGCADAAQGAIVVGSVCDSRGSRTVVHLCVSFRAEPGLPFV